MTVRYALPCAGLLVFAGAHCASTSKQASESPNPATREVATSQQASEQALKQAQEAQKQATEQAQKAAEAQARVRSDQEKLRQDQDIARQEQAKAQQLQTQARQESQQAAQQTQQQQQRAANVLSQQTQEIAKGQQTAAGVITRVRPDEVVVQPASGEAMRFSVNESTKVQIEGRTSTADEIREGQPARVSYEASANGPTAVSIRVGEAAASPSSGQGAPATGTGSTDTGSSPMNPSSPIAAAALLRLAIARTPFTCRLNRSRRTGSRSSRIPIGNLTDGTSSGWAARREGVGVRLDLEPARRAGPGLPVRVVVREHRVLADQDVVELVALALVLLHDRAPDFRNRDLLRLGLALALRCHASPMSPREGAVHG